MTTDDRLTEAARVFDLPPAVLLQRDRSRRVAEARNAVMWALRNAGMTCTDIAALFNRDHTTVLSNVAAAERLAVSDVGYALRLAAIRS